MRRRVLHVTVALTLAVATTACGVAPTPAPTADRPALGISNGTTLDVTIFVNDVRVGEYRASGPPPVIRKADLPALPRTVEARSASGRVLTSVRVEPARSGARPAPTAGHRTVAQWAVLTSRAVG